MTELELLELIHNDIGCVIGFLLFLVLVILLKYIYKFFGMFFKW